MKSKLLPALINAVMNNQITKVSQLLKYGADSNGCEDELRYSPLHYAAAHSGKEIAALLLEAGANLEAIDIDGNTPLNTAFVHQNKAFISWYRDQKYGNCKDINNEKHCND